jgi:hypothetical protein
MYRVPLLHRRVSVIYHVSHLASLPSRKESGTVVVVHSSNRCLCRFKALLFTLVRGFEFELALPAEDIVRMSMIVGRPVLASNPAAGPQLPLLIRLANMD